MEFVGNVNLERLGNVCSCYPRTAACPWTAESSRLWSEPFSWPGTLPSAKIQPFL